mmetsp:Transcript_24203/g.29340  ORF Transcript_24203/g.29340 Transcript_24203/m.29340 type:complete len:105 (-) Transcript_24203:358-672(-)
MHQQAHQIFLFLHKNAIPPPPLPLTTSIELINNRITISHYLPTDIKRLSPMTNAQVDDIPPITHHKIHKHQTKGKSSREQIETSPYTELSPEGEKMVTPPNITS